MKRLKKLFTRHEVFIVRSAKPLICSEPCPYTDTRVGSCVCAMCDYHVKTIFKAGKAHKVVCRYKKHYA